MGNLTRAGVAAALLMLTAGCGDDGPASQATVDPTPEPRGWLQTREVRVGECLVVPNLERPKAVRAVACDTPHHAEVLAVKKLERYPGEARVDRQAEDYCFAQYEKYIGVDFNDSVYQMKFLTPTPETWRDGSHQISCWVLWPEYGKAKGSVKGVNR